MTQLKGEIIFCGQKLKAINNASGHFVLETKLEANANQETHECVFQFSTESNEQIKRLAIINKLHVKFGHAQTHQLIRMLENSEYLKEFKGHKIEAKEIESVVGNCKMCWERKCRQNRPRNCVKRATMFNDCKAMDITEWFNKMNGTKILILHIVDEFSRLSVAKFIPDKKPESVMTVLFTDWLCVF